MKKHLWSLIVFLFSISNLSAQQIPPSAYGIDASSIPMRLSIGNKAPMFVTTDIHGDSIDTEKLLLNKPIVILFYRGQWCPVCSSYYNNISDSLSLLEEKATVLVIGPETKENALKMEGKVRGKFTLIADSSTQLLSDYKVLFDVTYSYQAKIKQFLSSNIAENNGQKRAKLPVPATYVINRKRRISFVQFDLNYRKRSTVKEILSVL